MTFSAVSDPRSFLLCDESTANLDPQTSRLIEEVVTGLHGVGILWITHHITPHTIKLFDVILQLDHGTLRDVTGQYKQPEEREGQTNQKTRTE